MTTMANDTVKQVTVLARDIQNKAAAVGLKLAKSVEFTREVREFSKRKDDNAVSAVHLSLLIEKLLDSQMVISMPLPGSVQSYKDKDTGQLVLNDNPDVYDDYDDDGKKVKGSYYWDVARMLDVGREVEEHQRLLREAMKPEVDSANQYAGKGEPEIKALKTTWQARKSAVKRAVTDGCQLAHALVLATNLEGVEVTIMRDPNDATKPIEGTHYPIMVADCSNTPNARGRIRFMSVPSFLALDAGMVDKAMVEKHKGEWQAFIATGARGKKGTGETDKSKLSAGASKYPPITSMDTFHDWALTGVNFVDANAEDGNAVNQAQLLKWAADPKTGDDVIETIYDLCLGFDPVFNMVEKRGRNIKAQRIAAKEHDKAA